MLRQYIRLLFAGIFITALMTSKTGRAQSQSRPSTARILQNIKKLNVLGNVLYFGAHPDDENPTFIAYMANEKLYNTAYFSLTRGDGGQNLLGTEIKENLGILRTQELLQARKIDGGQQFFSRAIDFGFSKNAEEVFSIWDREKLLSDAVWVIRNFKPDIIVTRFPPDERAGHGHHIASAILAEEAYDAAADPTRFPEQLSLVGVWKAKRLVWNAGMWWNQRRDEVDENEAKNYLKVDVGGFNPLLGKSYGEIAAQSRSLHRSQGFGTIGFRGSLVEFFKHIKGEKASKNLFDGVDTGWSRVTKNGKIDRLIENLVKSYDPSSPAEALPQLLAIRTVLEKLPNSYWRGIKLAETDKIIQDALGIYLQTTAGEFSYTPGEVISLKAEAINRSSVPVILKSIHFPFDKKDSLINFTLKNNQEFQFSTSVTIPGKTPYSQPYWLRQEGTLGLFNITQQTEIGLPENTPAGKITFDLEIAGKPFTFSSTILYQKTDPVLGEVYQSLTISPPVYVSVDQSVYLFDGQDDKKINVTVKAGKQHISGVVKLNVPKGWRTEPAFFDFGLPSKNSEKTFEFQLFPPLLGSEGELTAEVVLNDRSFNRSLGIISYQHIPTQIFFPLAKAKIVKVDITKTCNLIGYIKGAGDMVPVSLQQIGYNVELLHDSDISQDKLQKFDAVILGVRAYNTVERLKVINPVLLDYVEKGGNLIVQYNTDQGLLMDDFGPYPFKVSSKRVTVEQSEVRFLNPDCRALNYPNKITHKDFDGWVQERSLYQPESWSDKYETVISCNDPGSEKLDGGILIAKYGKGNYVYTTMSWFRQLPAGVPGAYRVFSNLISLGK